MLTKLTSRLGFFLILLCASAFLSVSFYLEWAIGLEPCPLCILQRVCLCVMWLIALVSLLHNPRRALGVRIYSGLMFVFSSLGLLAALRQLWMQSLPADNLANLSCGPSLNFMLENMPLKAVLQQVFWSSGECGVVTWTLLGLSLAGWTTIGFCFLLVFSLMLFIKEKARTTINTARA